MAYVLIEKNIVVQKQPNAQDGFIEVSDDVVCGQILQKDGTFKNPEPTQEQVDELERHKKLAALSETDKDMARISEDVIGILITKGLISVSDLPKTVTDKLAEREALRNSLKKQGE